MGGGYYDSNTTRSLVADRVSSGRAVLDYAADVAAGRVEAVVHPKLDPKRKNTEGKNVRESFDSEDHPNSVPIAVIFDTTSSMAHIPRLFVEKLPDLMDLILENDIVPDPQLLFGAVNDATCDPTAALEIGQFESGNQMDDSITKILANQGGGGGQSTESYQLAMYYMARHTDLDCVNKRNKKGYLFIIGDEKPYPVVSKEEVKTWIGDTIQADIPVKDILEELQEKFVVFWLFPAEAQNGRSTTIPNYLKTLFGQNFIVLKKADDICNTIAATIAIHEGKDPKEVAKTLAGKASHKADIDDLIAGIPPRIIDDL